MSHPDFNPESGRAETRPLALVTGGSRGIGAAIVWKLLSYGADVIVAARGLEDCERLAGLWEENGKASTATGRPARAVAFALDVTDPKSVAELPDFALRTFGRPITWLVNNAGNAHTAPLARLSEDDFRASLELNFHGPQRVTAALLPTLVTTPVEPRPAIVNISSSAGLHGYAYCAAYCAAKHALVGYTRAAAIELGPKDVSIHALAPHYVDTPMLADSIANVMAKTGKSADEARAFFAAQNPGGRLITPEEVAERTLECLLSPPTPERAVIEMDGSPRKTARS